MHHCGFKQARRRIGIEFKQFRRRLAVIGEIEPAIERGIAPPPAFRYDVARLFRNAQSIHQPFGDDDFAHQIVTERGQVAGRGFEILLDLPILAEGLLIFIVEGLSVSPNNVLFAYGIDTSGSRQPTMYICNLPAGTLAPETVGNTSGQYAWSADNTSVFYVLNDHTVRPYKVMRHRIGTDPQADREVYTEADSTFAVSLSTSRDDKYIYIASGYTEDRETRIIAAAQPDAAPVVIQPRLKDLAYSVVDQEGDVLYIRTNRDARNFKLVKAPMRSPGMQHWIDVLPHRDDALFENARVFTRYIVAQERIKGLTQILVVARPTGQSYEVDFGEQAYVANMSAATDAADLDSIRYSYSSLTTPLTDYRYDLI